jgi:two-component system sensor histidine kinase PilS (NtrC family)
MVRDRGREISQLKNMNRIIVSSIPSGLALIDVDGRLQYMNESFKEMVDGMSLVGGDSLWMVLPKLENRLKAYSSGGNSQVSRIEYKFNDSGEKKDRGRSLEILISPVQSREAGFTGYLLILQDLTDVKLLEQSLRQSEKLAAIGQLAAGIAHEIRNPLASISGSVQMLKALLRGDSNEDEAKLMAIVIREIDRLNLLIGEFLDYSRPDNRITEKVNLSELVIEIARLVALNDRLPKGIATHLDVEPDCFILADSGKLKQAVMNIVINAYQSFEGIGPGTIAIVLKRTGDRIKLSISDNGCGISTQELTRIFDPFHTTKNNGTGLGLAITHKILKNHRALVDVRSRIDEGTEFVIEIPPFVELSESAV